MVIYRDNISTIVYSIEEHNITYLEKGIVNKDLLLSQFRSVVEFSKITPIYSEIMNFKELHGSINGVFEYLNKTYIPELKARGLIYNAFVLSDDIISNHMTKLLMKEMEKNGVYSAIFSNEEAAEKWIRNQKLQEEE